MDDAFVVRRLERVGDLPGDVESLCKAQGSGASISASVGPSTSSMTSASTPP